MSSSRKNCALRVWRPPGGNFICYRPSNWQQWSPAGGVYQWLYFSFFDSFLNAPTNPLLFSRKQQLTSVTDAITAKITHRSHTVESRRLNVSYWLLSSPTRSFLLFFLKKQTNKSLQVDWPPVRLNCLVLTSVGVTWPANLHLNRNLTIRRLHGSLEFIYFIQGTGSRGSKAVKRSQEATTRPVRSWNVKKVLKANDKNESLEYFWKNIWPWGAQLMIQLVSCQSGNLEQQMNFSFSARRLLAIGNWKVLMSCQLAGIFDSDRWSDFVRHQQPTTWNASFVVIECRHLLE